MSAGHTVSTRDKDIWIKVIFNCFLFSAAAVAYNYVHKPLTRPLSRPEEMMDQ